MAMQIKRIYDPAQDSDGKRILVDRLWPRGVCGEKARLDGWPKDIAPSTALRQWFSHQPDRFDEFAKRCRGELALDPQKQAAVRQVLELDKHGLVTLLYAAKSPTINHAAILLGYLQEQAANP